LLVAAVAVAQVDTTLWVTLAAVAAVAAVADKSSFKR